MTILTAVAASIDQWRAARAVLAVAALASGGLVLANAWALVKPYVRGTRVGWVLASVGLAAALYLAGATPVRVLLALAVWGLSRRKGRRREPAASLCLAAQGGDHVVQRRRCAAADSTVIWWRPIRR